MRLAYPGNPTPQSGTPYSYSNDYYYYLDDSSSSPGASLPTACSASTVAVAVTFADSWGDGWNDNKLHIGSSTFSLDDYDWTSVSGIICLEPGVYEPYCCGGSYDSEISWTVGGVSGTADNSCFGTAGALTVTGYSTQSSEYCHYK